MPAERFKAFLERTRSEMADVIANCTYSDNFHAVVDRIAVLGGLLERFWPGGDWSED